ncbi:DJ-1/PfpI family protein [Microdochium trichocladiopsis]|uniref:DJ-1/PfpI family protein n=1 Tax=Microdochium trichocladiopsis TaxID=1682393 RepID=A0A9P8XXG6_9PEZI|nr:DJ-1/PfpI family protein [Microdochium trichocladiopsis]KAH7024602.1 DJ-1/PfpI family protein [Microdochium trichocladiopsis]
MVSLKRQLALAMMLTPAAISVSASPTTSGGHNNMPARALTNTSVPVRFGMVLFPAFTPLDVFGPLDMLNSFSLTQPLELALIAKTLDPVTTRLRNHQQANSNFSQSVVPTHTFANPPADLDVLFVPGGAGTRAVKSPDPELRLTELIAYIRTVYPSLKYLVSVCTGAQLLAQAGVLDGRTATTNKAAFNSTAAFGPRTYWKAHARWVVDGNIYTSAGVTAGIDATLQFIEDIWGAERARSISAGIEHVRHLTPDDDPFSAQFGLVDIPPVEQV